MASSELKYPLFSLSLCMKTRIKPPLYLRINCFISLFSLDLLSWPADILGMPLSAFSHQHWVLKCGAPCFLFSPRDVTSTVSLLFTSVMFTSFKVADKPGSPGMAV